MSSLCRLSSHSKFEDEGDDKNVNMIIPPEILEKMGWSEGTRIKVEWGDKGTIRISEVKDEDGET